MSDETFQEYSRRNDTERQRIRYSDYLSMQLVRIGGVHACIDRWPKCARKMTNQIVAFKSDLVAWPRNLWLLDISDEDIDTLQVSARTALDRFDQAFFRKRFRLDRHEARHALRAIEMLLCGELWRIG